MRLLRRDAEAAGELADGDGSHGTPCSGSSVLPPVWSYLSQTIPVETVLMYTFDN